MTHQRAQHDHLTRRFQVLGNRVRLRILDILRRGEACGCCIEAAIGRGRLVFQG